jgi:CheY-like chemotaxis protein
MPVMDGYEATRCAAPVSHTCGILPVIAMTANAMVGDREKVLAAGMNDHIAKPINVEEMFATLARWVRPVRHRRARSGTGTAVPRWLTCQASTRTSDMPAPLATRCCTGACSACIATNSTTLWRGFAPRRSVRRPLDRSYAWRTISKVCPASIGASAVQRAAEALEAACAGDDAVQRHRRAA